MEIIIISKIIKFLNNLRKRDCEMVTMYKDVTFLIPIFNLSEERVKNLKFILPYILQTGKKVIVVEQVKDNKSSLSDFFNQILDENQRKNFKHELYAHQSDIIHKTGMINWATENLIKTRYVWVNDADFYMKFGKVLNERWKENFIKPYSVAKKLSKEDSKKILSKEAVNVNYSDESAQYISLYSALSFIYERNSFLNIGGMDETLFGWGKEDLEFSNRLKNSKTNVQELDIRGIHLWHPPPIFTSHRKQSTKMMKFFLNYYFDQVYCVNLDRRGDRWELVKKQFDACGIRVKRYSAIDAKDITYDQFNPYICDKPYVDGKIVHEFGDIETKGMLGCLLSHLGVIKDAKENGHERILIFEDDVVLHESFESEAAKIAKLDWKLVYFGASQYDWSSLTFVENFYLSNNSYGTFAYAVDSSIYDLLIRVLESTKKTVDTALISIQKQLHEKCYTFYPNIVIPYVDESDIRNGLDISKHAELMRWDLNNFSLQKNKPKKVLLMPDARGWAFDNIANAVVKYNPYPDKIKYEIMYARDLHQHKCTINPDEWDLIYVMFEAERIIPRGKNVIRGCYSAYWLENPNYPPKAIGKYFKRCKGAIFANAGLKREVVPFLPPEFPTEVIHDASDEALFFPISAKKNKEFTVLFVGNTKRKIKNFPKIVDICNKADVKLMVCENIPNNKLVYEYCKADLCINFSTFEGGPQTFVEAALCSIPTLVKTTNELSLIIPCFVGRNEEEFVNILRYLKQNRQECEAKGKEAYDVAISKLTYRHAAKKFSDFFLRNFNKRNLQDELTVFVIRSGKNPNYEDCKRALDDQNCLFAIEEIVDISPMSAAFQQMIERCETPYYVQVDEDMILKPFAIERLYFSIKASKSNVCMVTYMLKDHHLDFNIFGVKVYKQDIMVNYPYDLQIISCEKDQMNRLEADGYLIDMIHQPLGVHSPKWTNELIYERYFDLMEKWKVYKYDWMKDMPKKLLEIFKREPNDTNFYAMAGAMYSLSSPNPIRKREKNFTVQEDNFKTLTMMCN